MSDPVPPPLPPETPVSPAAAAPPPRSSNKGIWLAIAAGCLIVAIPMVGIIAAIAIPNFLSAIQRGKQKRAMGEIRYIATAVQVYSTDNNAFPTDTSVLAPNYMSALPAQDSWEHPYEYYTWWDDEGWQHFQVISRGKDKAPDDGMGGIWVGGELGTNCFESDIVWQDDNFVMRPEGKQRRCN